MQAGTRRGVPSIPVLGPPSRSRRPQLRFFGIYKHGDKFRASMSLVGQRPTVHLIVGGYDTKIEVARPESATRSEALFRERRSPP